MSSYKKIYEFLLWDNCNNNCSFCFQREKPRLYAFNKRKYILDEVIKFIKSDEFDKGSHILICGGEIFDKPSDTYILTDFFKTIFELMKKNIVDLLYINTNLLYKDLTPLKVLLNGINNKNLFDRLKFTTSYDLKGRFKNKDSENLMLNNLKWVKDNYPNCNIVTNTILTKQVCEAILNKTFNLQAFMERYKCWINLIPYIILDDTLTAPRELIFKALKQVNLDVPEYLNTYISNMSITQEKLLYMYKDDHFIFCSCEIDKCGHSINFKRYSTKGTCFCCDLKEIFKEYA